MKKFDLIVVGGGFSGFGAAVAAARQGLKTLLIEKTNALSGAANFGLVLPFMPFSTVCKNEQGKPVTKALSAGIFEEIYNHLEQKDLLKGDSFDNEYLKLLMNRMAIEAGVELLFNSTVVSVKREANSIKSVTVFGRGNTLELEADFFIDCTGDANLLTIADFPTNLGREEDSLCQPMTLCFRLANVDVEGFYSKNRISEVNKLFSKYKAEGKIKNPRENVLVFKTIIPNVLHFNTTRVVKLNPTNMFDVTKAELEAREQMYELLDFLKENFEEFKNAQIVASATEIGIRESRMAVGEYTLTGNQLRKCAKFDDSVATGNYDIDIHNPEGEGTSHYYFPAGEYYEIPYRCLIPKNAENLLVAGRCISVDHEAQASIRIMPIVCTLGQAAGTAVAIAKQSKTNVQKVNIKKLQEVLLQNGAVIH